MEKEILYKIVLDWYNATVVGADGFDEEWDEVCDSIEYKLNEKIERGYIETVEELIEVGKELIGKELGDYEALKFEKIANEANMKSYKFEIWWNTGDWHWDNEPDIEFFDGTIDQLNDHINDEVKGMNLEHIGWDEELADINEEDIEELKSTGTLQKYEDNVVWMVRSVEDSLKESKMRVNEGLFDPKPWSAKGIEKAKKVKQLPPHRYSVHMTNLNVEQLFGLMAMNNIKNGVELFGFGFAKIEGRYYLYLWHPAEYNWYHPKMGRNKLTKQSSEIKLNLLSTDFTDEMADDLGHWIESKELLGVGSGRVWPIFNFKNYGSVYEGIMVFGNDESSIRKYVKLYDKLTNGRNALPIESGNYTGQVSEIPNHFQMGSYLSVDLDPEEIMSLGIGQRDIRDETAGKNYGEVTLDESEKRFPGLNDYMKNDVENIFEYNPDMSMDYFLNSVTGEGDEGYDPECAAIMWEYYEYLQSR